MTVYESSSTGSNVTSVNNSTVVPSQTINNGTDPTVSQLIPVIVDRDQTGGQTSMTSSKTQTGVTGLITTPIQQEQIIDIDIPNDINVTLSVLPINPIEIYSIDFLDQTTVLKNVQIQIQASIPENTYGYLAQILIYIKSNILYSFINKLSSNIQEKYKDNDIYISTIDTSDIIHFNANGLFWTNLKIYFTKKPNNTILNTRIDNTINFTNKQYSYQLNYITYQHTTNQSSTQTNDQSTICIAKETTTLYVNFSNSWVIIPIKYIYGSNTQTQTNTRTDPTPEPDNINTNVNILNHIIVQSQDDTDNIIEKGLGIKKNILKTYYFDLNNLQYQIYLSKQEGKEKELNFNINVLLRNNFSLSNFKIDQSAFLPKYIQQYFTGNYNIFKDSLPVIFNNEIIEDSKYTKGYIKSTKQYVALKSEKQHLIDKFEVYPYKAYRENTFNPNRTEDIGYYLDFDKSYFKKICQNIENVIMAYSFYHKRISKINNIDIKTALKYKKNILGIIPLLRFPVVNVNKSLVDNNILIKKSKVCYNRKSEEMYKEMYRYFGNIDIPFKKIVNKIKNVYSLFNPVSTNQYKIFDNENIYRNSNKIIPLTYDNQYRASEEIYIDQYNKRNPDNPNLPLSIEYTNFNDSKFYNLDTTIELCDNLYRTKREISLLNEKSYLIDLFTEYLGKSNIKNYHWNPDEILFLFNKYTYKKVEIPMIINHVTNNKFYILKYTLELI